MHNNKMIICVCISLSLFIIHLCMAVVFCLKEMCLFQSIYEPNFRYTGARVCHFMCIELKDHPVFGDFKMEFLKK